jgi:hypothetical protein
MGEVGTFLSIDPGLDGTGWSAWSRKDHGLLVPPLGSGTVECHYPEWPWWIRAQAISAAVQNLAWRFEACYIYVELPRFMESAGAGLAAARKGDLVKLAFLVGDIAGRLCGPPAVRTYVPVPVADWKGGMPKTICHNRILERLPGWKPTTKTSHELDSVGIGLFVKGFF